MDMDLPKEQSEKKVVKKSSKSKSVAASLHKIKHKISKRTSESTSRQRFKNSTKKTSNEQRNSKITYKDQKKHRSVLQESTLRDGHKLTYMHKGKALKTGYKKGCEILCSCCDKVFSPTAFESHAGRPSTRKPYHHIFLEDGMSLHLYASSLKPNAMKDARVSGADPVKQIAEQCIENDDPDGQVSCVLCRLAYFRGDIFGDETSLICDQCEKEYHVGCLKKYMNIHLQKKPLGNWFCTEDCKILHSSLKDLASWGPLNAKYDYMQIAKKKFKGSIKNRDMKWIVINGKEACEEKKLLITQAVDMFHECFNPIVDAHTGIDFIPSMAYGMEMGSLDFSGVYTALITINSKVITAGMFRAFGREFAELSFVATSRPNRKKGYLQLFFLCFERLLSHLRIKKLVIPAADDAMSMWTEKFGFKEVPEAMLTEYKQTQTSMVAFQGTTLLQKDTPFGLTEFERRTDRWLA